MVAALPVLAAQARVDWQHYQGGSRPEFRVGYEFITINGERTWWLFTLARWACIPFSLLGGYVCFRWSTDLYGPVSGLVSLTLWCFCPNILAWGATINPDVGAAAVGVFACWLFAAWLKKPSWSGALGCALALGVALLIKSTWLILLVVWAGLLSGNMLLKVHHAVSRRIRTLQLLTASLYIRTAFPILTRLLVDRRMGTRTCWEVIAIMDRTCCT
jgi:hypothetical protein